MNPDYKVEPPNQEEEIEDWNLVDMDNPEEIVEHAAILNEFEDIYQTIRYKQFSMQIPFREDAKDSSDESDCEIGEDDMDQSSLIVPSSELHPEFEPILIGGMPRGRGRRGRGGGRRKKGNNAQMSSIRRMVKSEIKKDREIKFVDEITTLVNVPVAGQLFGMLNIAQGIGINQRIGDQITLEKIEVNLNVTAANSDIYSHTRVIFFQWHPNQALLLPTVAMILETPTQTFQSFYNFEYRNQFSVLIDHTFSLTGTAGAPTDKSDNIWVARNLPIHHRKVEFAVGATTSSQCVYLLFIGDSAAVPFPLLQMVARVYFSDG